VNYSRRNLPDKLIYIMQTAITYHFFANKNSFMKFDSEPD